VQNDFANNISECDVLHLAPHLEDSAAPHGRRHCSPSATTRAAGAVTAPGATTRQRCAGTLLPAAGGAPGTPRRQRAPASPPHRPRIAGVGAVGVAGQGGAGETPRVEASRLAAGEPARADDVIGTQEMRDNTHGTRDNTRREVTMQLSATLTCPHCAGTTSEIMPIDACRVVYTCPHCAAPLRPLPGDCCVFCSYADTPCPPSQSADPCGS